MNHLHDILRTRLLHRAGIVDDRLPSGSVNLSELRDSEWSPAFERYMRNRLVLGAIRYGGIHNKRAADHDRISSIRSRLAAYTRDGNDEHLVDIANLCLVEFMIGTHPRKHFSAKDSDAHRLQEVR